MDGKPFVMGTIFSFLCIKNDVDCLIKSPNLGQSFMEIRNTEQTRKRFMTYRILYFGSRHIRKTRLQGEGVLTAGSKSQKVEKLKNKGPKEPKNGDR